ncbi:MAG TPA: 4Fe-4S dicluster domain-containing protein [Anaeromyxobacter sp.]|nr:4Fe-4S dicluster domain-containing protein [Anaeromyxobacter sp.]
MLRRIRAGIALAVLVLATVAFLDFGRLLPAGLAGLAARLQLAPAAIRLPASSAALLLSGIAIATLLVGRVYCSTLCPLGTLQDLFIRLGDLRHRRGRYRFRRLPPRAGLHLSAAALATALAGGGSFLLLGFLEPYSGFGRIVSAALRPLAAAGLNGISRALSARHLYALAPVTPPSSSPGELGVALGSLVAIAALALGRGRLFCNLLCPAGAVLRLLSLRTALRLRIDERRCDGCGVCEKSCKAGCIDAGRRRIDFSACIGCFDCLDVCPRDGVRLGPTFAPTEPEHEQAERTPDRSRRALLKAAVLAPAALFAPAAHPPADPRDAREPITPPGSGNRRRFTARCTACHLCVAACPTQVLRPALLSYGAAGLLEPRLVYDHGSCVYDCTRCGEVCPTGAISRLPLSEKHLAQVGRARFVRDDCIVVLKHTVCGACAEHCPTKAIAMVPIAGQSLLRLPEVNEEVCIGCGACEHPCPTQPRRAIYVEARLAHGTAKRLEATPLGETLDSGFPF